MAERETIKAEVRLELKCEGRAPGFATIERELRRRMAGFRLSAKTYEVSAIRMTIATTIPDSLPGSPAKRRQHG